MTSCKVSECCDLGGMKLNSSKTKTMIVSWLLTIQPQATPLTVGGTVLKESDELVILGVIFDSKMTFEKHLRSVSRAVSQRLGMLKKSWPALHDRLLLGRCFRVLSCSFWSTDLPFGARLPLHTIDYWTA